MPGSRSASSKPAKARSPEAAAGEAGEAGTVRKEPDDDRGAAVQLTVTRVGGPLPTLRPRSVHALDALDAATREAALAFVCSGARVRSAAHPEAMNYLFELAGGDDAPRRRSCPYTEVPETLRGLLPR